MTAEHNIQVAQPTTPAQYFHLLRRQVKRQWSKPLVVLTPKSLLRHPGVVSSLDDFCTGQFLKIMPDSRASSLKTDRVLLCSGKVYYDLIERRRELQADNVAIVRIEQFYPLAPSDLLASFQAYSSGIEVFWVQEEPANMGAWQFLKVHYGDAIAERFKLRGISRVESASPSTGSSSAHKLEQVDLLNAAFADLPT